MTADACDAVCPEQTGRCRVGDREELYLLTFCEEVNQPCCKKKPPIPREPAWRERHAERVGNKESPVFDEVQYFRTCNAGKERNEGDGAAEFRIQLFSLQL